VPFNSLVASYLFPVAEDANESRTSDLDPSHGRSVVRLTPAGLI